MGCIKRFYTPIRDAVESAASLAGNYYLPGSSLLTDHLVSKGSQKQLGSTLGQLAQAGTGLSGAGVGSSMTGIPSASSVGGGWENFGNTLGNAAGVGNVGTNIASGISSGVNKLSGVLDVGGSSSLPNLASSGAGGTGALTGTGFDYGANPATFGAPASIAPSTPSLSTALASGTGGGASAFGSSPAGGYSSYGPLASALAGGGVSLLSNKKALDALKNATGQAVGTMAPYTTAGNGAVSKLTDLLGTSGNTGNGGYGSLTAPFNPSDLQNDPGYQFQLQQGNQALDRKAAAGGDYFSGAALKGAQDYGQGLANTQFQNAFSRDLATKQNTYGDLAGLTNTGAGSAANTGNLYENMGNAKAGSNIATGNTINSTLSSLLSGNGAKRPVNIGGQIYYM